jgi:hypothetical protein
MADDIDHRPKYATKHSDHPALGWQAVKHHRILPLAVSAFWFIGQVVWAQQPNQSLMHQQIQPTNQPQNLMQGQMQSQMQIQTQNQMLNQAPNQTQNQMLNQVPNQTQNQMLNQVPNQTQNQIPQTNAFSPPVLHGLDQNNSTRLTEPAASSGPSRTSPVEAFFQVAPAAPPSTALKQHGRTYSVLWHVMDNIGIPMFGNKDPDIDPALSHPFVMPPQAPGKNAEHTDAAVGASAPQTKPTIIDPQAAAQNPSDLAADDTSTKASATSNPTSNPQ